jgi:hypothetical protein
MDIGIFKEVTFNLTSVQEAGAYLISENVPILSKVDPEVIKKTSLAAVSTASVLHLKPTVVKLISSATFNLI